MGAERPDKRAMRCRISAEVWESGVMTRRTASRAKVPRCESENRVQPVVVSSSTGERVAMMVAQVGCSSHPPQQNAPHGIGKPTANRDPGRLRRRTDIALPTGGEWWIKHGGRGRPAPIKRKSPAGSERGRCNQTQESKCKTMIPQSSVSANGPMLAMVWMLVAW